METEFNVKGMHCKSCEMLIEDALMDLKGVKKVNIDHKTGVVLVDHDNVDLGKIKSVIVDEGYEVL